MSAQLNHDSPTSIRNLLAREGIAARKRWGQNFLVNRGLREKIINYLEIEPGMHTWEIGPGLGAMSEMLVLAGSSATLFEIDPAYCRLLRARLVLANRAPNVDIVEGDIMRTWTAQWETAVPDRVLGNLPYNAASAIIASFIESGCLARRCVFTVQDEMGKRMTALPNSGDYSPFSILCQTACRLKDGGRISPGSFFPVPRVHSRIVIMEPAILCGEIANPTLFRMIVRQLFVSRRKTLANNIEAAARRTGFPPAALIKEAFESLGIVLNARPENISPDQWVAAANILAKNT